MKIIILQSFGNSMMPLLHNHDVLYLKKIKLSSLRVNDLIGIKAKNKTIIHRIIYFKKGRIITKGDNNLLSDGKINKSKIVGIVYKIKRNGKIFVPDRFYLYQSSIYLNELKKIDNMLRAHNIPYVILKGLPLHLHITKNHPRRLYADCDMLIKPGDFTKTTNALQKLGYEYKPTKEISFLSNNNQINIESTYVKIVSDIPVIIDLHQSIVFMMTQLDNLDCLYAKDKIVSFTKELFERRKDTVIDNAVFPLLTTVDLIIYLSLHMFHHNFRGTARYEMLDSVLRSSKLDKQKIYSLCEVIKKYRMENFIYPVLILLDHYYQSPYAIDIARIINPNNIVTAYFERKIKTLNIFDNQSRIRGGITRFKNLVVLSPSPFYLKLLVFADPYVFTTILKYMLNKTLRLFGTDYS